MILLPFSKLYVAMEQLVCSKILITAVQNRYKNNKIRVKIGCNLTDCFETSKRQNDNIAIPF